MVRRAANVTSLSFRRAAPLRNRFRELVEDHVIQVQYVHSADNLADFFTKALPAKTFFKLRNIIMNVH